MGADGPPVHAEGRGSFHRPTPAADDEIATGNDPLYAASLQGDNSGPLLAPVTSTPTETDNAAIIWSLTNLPHTDTGTVVCGLRTSCSDLRLGDVAPIMTLSA